MAINPYDDLDIYDVDVGDTLTEEQIVAAARGTIDPRGSTNSSANYGEWNGPDVIETVVTQGQQAQSATWASVEEANDWRVRLSIPSIPSFADSPLLAPLVKSNNSFVFPYTPSIVLGQSATYNALTPVHSNYPFHVYQHSSIEPITINGDFYVETARDAAYWVGAVHYLRSMTKMFYGESSNTGNPPPIVKLNGYGDFVFNDIPVVITNFTVELLGDVDYVSLRSGGIGDSGSGTSTAHVPTQSIISVTCQPIYSRKKVSKFSLDSFVRGEYITNKGGFI